MNGSRNAAISGGTIAFRIAIASDAMIAPPKPLTTTWGTSSAATSSETAESSHETTTRSGWKRGRAGRQTTCSPYEASPAIPAAEPNNSPSR